MGYLSFNQQQAVLAHEVSHLIGGIHTDEGPSRPLNNTDQWESYIEFRREP